MPDSAVVTDQPSTGAPLVSRVLEGQARAEAIERAASMPRLTIDTVGASDFNLLANGGYTPLTGFMNRADYTGVVDGMRLANGQPWSLPITLAVSREQANGLRDGQEIALEEEGGRLVGILELQERFEYDREREASQVYCTTDQAHPGVARLYEQPDVLLAGPIWMVDKLTSGPFESHELTPSLTRAAFAERGWKTIVGFQTRNPIHRAHEYVQKCAMEIVDGLLLHPLVGATKSDDIPADVRMRSYQALLGDYYPSNRVLLSVFPAAMRYAGPREAIFHALCRKNYGCTHFIVGRDHAGVGNYYGTYDAQHIFSEFAPGELGITPLFFEHTYFCRRCDSIVSAKTCPHGSEHHVVLSGTMVREMLQRGEPLPTEFSRPEVAAILIDGMRGSA